MRWRAHRIATGWYRSIAVSAERLLVIPESLFWHDLEGQDLSKKHVEINLIELLYCTLKEHIEVCNVWEDVSFDRPWFVFRKQHSGHFEHCFC